MEYAILLCFIIALLIYAITYWFRLDIPHHMIPQTSHLTTLSVLHSENHTVINVLVDMVISPILCDLLCHLFVLFYVINLFSIEIYPFILV